MNLNEVPEWGELQVFFALLGDLLHIMLTVRCQCTNFATSCGESELSDGGFDARRSLTLLSRAYLPCSLHFPLLDDSCRATKRHVIHSKLLSVNQVPVQSTAVFLLRAPFPMVKELTTCAIRALGSLPRPELQQHLHTDTIHLRSLLLSSFLTILGSTLQRFEFTRAQISGIPSFFGRRKEAFKG